MLCAAPSRYPLKNLSKIIPPVYVASLQNTTKTCMLQQDLFAMCVEIMQNHSTLDFFGFSGTSLNTNHPSAAAATAATHVDHKSQLERDYQKHSNKSAVFLELPLEASGIFCSWNATGTSTAHLTSIHQRPSHQHWTKQYCPHGKEQCLNSVVLPEYLGLFLIKYSRAPLCHQFQY